MPGDETQTPPTPAEAARLAREARLAAALRANLRRRKSQDRGREALEGAEEGGAPVIPATVPDRNGA